MTKAELQQEIRTLTNENDLLRQENSRYKAALRFTAEEYESGQLNPRTMYTKMLTRLFSMLIVRIQELRRFETGGADDQTAFLLLQSARMLKNSVEQDLAEKSGDSSGNACRECCDGNNC